MVYKQGEAAIPGAGSVQIAPKDMTAGTYIFYYKAPLFTFRFISAETLTSVIKSWFSIRQKLGATDSGGFLDVKGVTINTDTGDIYVKAVVTPVKEKPLIIDGKEIPAPTEAGVNPLAVLAIVGGLFAAIGIAVTLLAVYQVKPAVSFSFGLVIGGVIALAFVVYLVLRE